MIEDLYLPNKKKKIIVVTFLVSDLPSGYMNMELLGELPIKVWLDYSNFINKNRLFSGANDR